MIMKIKFIIYNDSITVIYPGISSFYCYDDEIHHNFNCPGTTIINSHKELRKFRIFRQIQNIRDIIETLTYDKLMEIQLLERKL